MHKLYMIYRNTSQFLFCVEGNVFHTSLLAEEKVSPPGPSLAMQKEMTGQWVPSHTLGGNKGNVCFRSKMVFVTLWTVTHKAPLSMGFPRQECWSGLPFPPPADLPVAISSSNRSSYPRDETHICISGRIFTVSHPGSTCKKSKDTN